ncbi:lsu ribosomal protein l18p [Cystoisospora suis]|uniref:Lsu ribosomal protein l18p n=1 Tax=Cystoisospora suis TaxID=483139 RepID=A0A2C6L652_9APIC|nr:lsu ribosomal protein l18p [Cystoisospora suis]
MDAAALYQRSCSLWQGAAWSYFCSPLRPRCADACAAGCHRCRGPAHFWARYEFSRYVFCLLFFWWAWQCCAAADVQVRSGPSFGCKFLRKSTWATVKHLQTRELIRKRGRCVPLGHAKPPSLLSLYRSSVLTAFLSTPFALGGFSLRNVRVLLQQERISHSRPRPSTALTWMYCSPGRHPAARALVGLRMRRGDPVPASSEPAHASTPGSLAGYSSEAPEILYGDPVSEGRPTATYRQSQGSRQGRLGCGRFGTVQEGREAASVTFKNGGLHGLLESDKVLLGEKRARLTLTLSNNQVHACIVDNRTQRTYAYASSFDACLREEIGSVQRKRGMVSRPHGGTMKAARAVGRLLARRALKRGIRSVFFDRKSYR